MSVESKCQRCGMPYFTYSEWDGDSCRCKIAVFSFPPVQIPPAPPDPAFTGCRPLAPLTENDVRRIVREEIGRIQAAALDAGRMDGEKAPGQSSTG